MTFTKKDFPKWEELEREYLIEALKLTHGNKSHAAQLTGMSLRTIRLKVHHYKLSEFIYPSPACKWPRLAKPKKIVNNHS